MEHPRLIYRNIAKGQKVGYWTVVTNVLLILVTFWLGLVVQNMIAKTNANASGTLANIGYVEKVKPQIDTLNIHYSKLFLDFEALSSKDVFGKPVVSNADALKLKDYLKQHQEIILSYYKDLSRTMSQVNHVDYNCPKEIRAKAQLLPLYALLIESVDEYTSQNRNISWEKMWDSLFLRIQNLIRTPEYVSQYGLVFSLNNKGSKEVLALKKIYMELEKCQSSDRAFQLLLTTLPNALDVHKWLLDHSTFQPLKSHRLIEKILNRPFITLILLIFFGFSIAWAITMLLPWDKEINSTDVSLGKIEKAIGKIGEKITQYNNSINDYSEQVLKMQSKLDNMVHDEERFNDLSEQVQKMQSRLDELT